MSLEHSSIVAHLDVAAGRRLDLRKLRSAELRPCGNEVPGLPLEPRAPVGPPAPRHLVRAQEPLLSVLTEAAVDPVASLVAGSRVDHAGNVSARGQRETDVAFYQLRGAVGGLPGNDVVLAAR